MNEEELVKKLNWFYTLEITQVENYLIQSKAIDDKYLKVSLERVAFSEESHVDNISKIIIALGHSPNIVGDVLSPIIGVSMGKIISLTDLSTMMRLNIKVEAKAATDYREMIEQLTNSQGEKGVLHTLRMNMIDEDMHASWFYHVMQYSNQLDEPLSAILSRE